MFWSDCLIAKVYRILSKMNLEDEYVKDCMVKWANFLGYNIMLDKQENVWSNGLKCTLNYNLKDFFLK